MKTTFNGARDRSAQFHLTSGRVSLEERVRREVALHPGGYLGRRKKRISPYAAVTIASWWRRGHPILGALVEHYPVDRRELLVELDVIAANFAQDDADDFDKNALAALQHFVSEYDE